MGLGAPLIFLCIVSLSLVAGLGCVRLFSSLSCSLSSDSHSLLIFRPSPQINSLLILLLSHASSVSWDKQVAE